MAYVEWSEAYVTGVVEIDDDHRALFELLNSLFAAVADRQPKDALAEGLGALTLHLTEHFAREERMMLAANYPQYAAHRTAHEGLLRRMSDVGAAFALDPGVLGDSGVQALLRKCVADHILGHDMALAGLNTDPRADSASIFAVA